MMRTPTPAWLRQHLIDTGVWSADGITRKAKLRTHTCGLLVLTGLDADLAAFPATVDPTPLTTTGEMLALLGNRDTYDYRPTTHELDGPRNALRITWAPANTRPGIHVLPAHACNQPPLPHLQIPAPPIQEATDAPPF
jgi:hypothetical protein